MIKLIKMKSFLFLSFFILDFALSLNTNIISSLLSLKDLNEQSKLGIHYDPIEEKEKNNLRGELFSILREIVEKRKINSSAYNISKSCKNVINRYLLGHVYDNNISSSNISYIISDYNIIKLLDDSSKNRNNLGTYDQCMQKTYKFWDKLNIIDKDMYNNETLEEKTYSTYVILSRDRNYTNDEDINILELDFYYSLQGYCFPQGYNNNTNGEYCTDEDYKNILLYYNDQFHDLFQLQDSRIEVFTLKINPIDSEKTSSIMIFLSLLPFIYFCLQGAIYLIYVIIVSIYKKCKKDKINKNEQIKENRDETFDGGRISDFGNKMLLNPEKKNEKQKFFEFVDCFNFLENGKELFNFSINSTKYNNDSGLNYVRGLIGFSSLFIVVGFTFMAAYNSPIKVSSPNQLSDFFKDEYYFYLIIMIGIRYSPRLIISCSGYLLAFKYVSYLDRNCIRNLEPLFKSTLKFISFQIHKFFLLFLVLLFQRYSAIELYKFFYETESPTFKYYYKYILNKPKVSRFFLSFTLIGNFFQYKDEQYRNRHHLLMYFWLPFNEIIFFLIGIFIIFIGFKFKKFKIDIFILCLIPILYIWKIFYSYFLVDFEKSPDEDDGLEFPIKKCYSTLFYVFFNYGRDMINPLFNLSYYLIGMYFGLVNYTIQKGINKIYKSNTVKSFITKEEMEGLLIKKENESSDVSSSNSDENDEIVDNKLNDNENEKNQELRDEIKKMPFLITPVKFVIWNRKQNKKIFIFLIISTIALFLLIILSIIIADNYYDSINKAFENFFINLIYRLDIELVIILMQWLFFYCIQIKNIYLDFLSNILWITLSRPYFSFILVINTVLLFIFYHDETLIEINSISILMYSLIGIWFTFLTMSIFYILYELPLKRVTRLFYIWNINDKELKDNDEDLDNDEDDNNKIKSE